MQVTTAQFRQDIDRYQEAAVHEPVAISKDGRPHTVLVSAFVYELLLKGRVARLAEDWDDETVQAMADARMGDEHAHLDELIKDWQP